MKTKISFATLFFLAVGALFSPKAMAVSIESGMCKSASLSYLARSHYYEFYAATNDTILVRLCNTDPIYYPSFLLEIRRMERQPDATFEPVDPPIYTDTVNGAGTGKLTITQSSWYQIRVYENVPYPYSFTYNISFLRMPGYPLSTADLDVGPIREGEYLDGDLLAGDLDAATFPITNTTLVQVRMGQVDPGLVPNISLYDPYGTFVESDYPPEYRAEVTAIVSVPGIYTAVLRDNHDNSGNYYVSMVQIPPSGPLAVDKDIGPIVHGETIPAEIDVPGDLDLAWFPAVSGDVVRVTMTKLVSDFNPRIEVYTPSAALIVATNDWFQIAAQATINCVEDGNYYIICKDSEDRTGPYNLHVELLGGPSTNNVPDAPTGVTASDGAYDDHIYVSWNASAGSLSYEVWRYHGTNESLHVTNTTATSFADYTAPSNTLCFYRVKGKNSYGTSAFSDSDSGYYGVVVSAADRMAILVGINNYAEAYGATPLQGCSNDVTLIKNRMLLGDESNRWDEANIRTLFDKQATKVSVRNLITSVASVSEPGALVFYQQSSHGGTYGGTDAFLSMFDADYTDKELASDLALFHTDVDVVLMIDACHSGGLFKGADGEKHWPFAENVMRNYRQIKSSQLRSQGRSVPRNLGDNIAFMTAANFDQTSWDYSFDGTTYYGLFTYYFAEACTNAAADINSDREFQFLELFNYAAPRASAINPDQTAQTYNETLLKNLVARSAPEAGASPETGRLRAPVDYDGDGTSDMAVYNYHTGNWFVYSLKNGVLLWDINFGGAGFTPVPGDYDASGLSDLAVYNQATGNWYIYSLRNGLIVWEYNWGGGPFRPVPGDFDGDKRFDFSIYDINTGYWYINSAVNKVLVWGETWTGIGLVAVPGDFDGDRNWDIATYSTDTGHWFIRPANTAKEPILWGTSFGITGAMPVSGDYTGNGKSDLATYNNNTGIWDIRTSEGVVIVSNDLWGGPGFVPVAGDFDGDGKFDMAVYHEATGRWYIKHATGDTILAWGFEFGGPGFMPVRLNQ